MAFFKIKTETIKSCSEKMNIPIILLWNEEIINYWNENVEDWKNKYIERELKRIAEFYFYLRAEEPTRDCMRTVNLVVSNEMTSCTI